MRSTRLSAASMRAIGSALRRDPFPLLQMEQEHGSLLRALLHRAKQRRRSGEPRKPRHDLWFYTGHTDPPQPPCRKNRRCDANAHPITSIQQEDGAWLVRISAIVILFHASCLRADTTRRPL